MLTDAYTSYRAARPSQSSSCGSLLLEVKRWVSSVGKMPNTLWLRSIRTDNAYLGPPLSTWCLENGIKLTSCAPHTHQQNAIAETTVKMIKRVVRRNEFTAWTGTYLRALCYTYTGHQLNRTPSSTDPSGHRQSPGNHWPSAPFYHPTQELHPWGCLVHGFAGQRNKTSNRSPNLGQEFL